MSGDGRIAVLYDGLCPLCRREAEAMRRRDRDDRLEMVDITAPGFEASSYGLSRQAVHRAMHAILPDGTVARGMAAFRVIYRALGLGWLVAPTGWPVLRPIFDALYAGFARVRPRLPGRGREACDDRSCDVSQPRTNRPVESQR